LIGTPTFKTKKFTKIEAIIEQRIPIRKILEGKKGCSTNSALQFDVFKKLRNQLENPQTFEIHFAQDRCNSSAGKKTTFMATKMNVRSILLSISTRGATIASEKTATTLDDENQTRSLRR
jgi:hypothetical protein